MVVLWNWNLILNLSLRTLVTVFVFRSVSGSAGDMTEMITLSPSIFAWGALSSPLPEHPAATSAAAAVTATIFLPGFIGYSIHES